MLSVYMGALLGLGVLLTITRTVIRLCMLKLQVCVDDCFLFLATVTLAAGTILTYTNVPGYYANIIVQDGLMAPTEVLVQG